MAKNLIEVYTKDRVKTAVLQNAFDITEELTLNGVNHLSFSLPNNDNKNIYCKPFCLVRYDNGDFYRIMPSTSVIDETGKIRYTAEHVLATLIDNILFGEHIVGNLGVYTKDVIKYILDHQLIKNWALGQCDFSRQFEYAWTGETLLSALFSVANRFTENYIWTWDTSSYPWKINLKLLNEKQKPQMYVRERKNLKQLTVNTDAISLFTRIYPLGAGEGINQVNIKKINGGLPYLQAPKAITDKYGIIEREWVDRRYENPESLMEAAQVMLNESQEPLEEYSIDVALLGDEYLDVPTIGEIVEIVGFKKTYITGITYNHGENKTAKLTIANKSRNVAGTIADMMDRQRIEMTYSQGATQFWQDHVYDNADSGTGIMLKLRIPKSVAILNEVLIDVELLPFRMPFSVTESGGGTTMGQNVAMSSGSSSITTTQGGGAINATSSDGGGTTVTSASGGNYSSSTESGGSTELTSGTYNTQTYKTGLSTDVEYQNTYTQPNTYPTDNASAGTPHVHGMAHTHYVGQFPIAHKHFVEVGQHFHKIILPTHSHYFSVSSHSHMISIGSHSHTIYIDGHTHGMSHNHDISHTHTIGTHTHALKPGIMESGGANGFKLRINGVDKKTVAGKTLAEDITEYLLNAQKMIPRDVFHKIEIIPNSPAYIMLTVNVQGFIQSRGDKTV